MAGYGMAVEKWLHPTVLDISNGSSDWCRVCAFLCTLYQHIVNLGFDTWLSGTGKLHAKTAQVVGQPSIDLRACECLTYACAMANASKRLNPTTGLLKTQRRRTAKRSIKAIREGRVPGAPGPTRKVAGSKGAQPNVFCCCLSLAAVCRWA